MLESAMMTGLHQSGMTEIPGDVMGMIIQAYRISNTQSQTSLPSKPPWARRSIQPFFTGVGLLTSAIVERLPARAALWAQDRVFAAISGDYQRPFDAIKPALERALPALRRAEKDAAKPAALLVLLSHPPALGDVAALNVEMVRHAVLALRFLRAKSCRPRLVIACDEFALDMLSLPIEGFYAGYVSGSHLAINRVALRQSFHPASCLRKTAADVIPWRLWSRLRAGQEVGMMLSGGVPATGRALYVVREWVRESWRLRPRADAREVLERLRQSEDFRNFEAALPRQSLLRKNVSRLCQGWAAACALGLRRPGAGILRSACETGVIDAATQSALRVMLEAFGYDQEVIDARLKSLDEEFGRETPFRRQLFKILARRVLSAGGRPVMFIPISHGLNGRDLVRCGDCWIWSRGEAGVLTGVKVSGKEESWSGTVEEFARRFVSENFA